MDLVGPFAQSTECPLEKWFRDAKIYQLFEGTAEIQRMVISRMQAQEYRDRFAESLEAAVDASAQRRGGGDQRRLGRAARRRRRAATGGRQRRRAARARDRADAG